jgi:hypothetical protein
MFSGTIVCCSFIMATASVTALVHAATDYPTARDEAAAIHSASGHAEMASEVQVQGSPMPVRPPAPQSSIGDRGGIRVDSVRLSGHGHIVIFRYRVIDPIKALTVINPQTKPRIIEQESGSELSVPNLRMIGSFRQTPRKLIPERTYFVAFANNGAVRNGSKVTVILGDLKFENLVVSS